MRTDYTDPHMAGKTNRKAEIRICLAYCEPENEPVTFQTIALGSVSEQLGINTDTYPIDRIFIPEGYDKPISDLPIAEMVKYWASKENYWKELIQHLQSHK